MTVGQSVMWAMVMLSLLGRPLCVCEVGEGPFSLNHPQSHYPDHLSYSILRGSSIVTCLCFLSLFFQGIVCKHEEDPHAGL